MKVIYRAENTIDANLLKGLLAQEGIVAFVNGSYLQGGVGELPATGLVTVSVADNDVEAAGRVSQQFQKNLADGVYALNDQQDQDLDDNLNGDWVEA